VGSGWRWIDEITTDDEVLSRDEHDPSGPLAWKKVEETFERVGLVLELEVGGRTIGTTAEHPFYVLSKGWTAAGELKPGDRIVGLDPRESVAVTALRLTGRQEKLYNLRVADYHTYFVGGSTWGFALWAHNTYKDTFFKVYPELRGRVWVHHAIPQTVLKKYPGLFTRMEIDAFSNLRGIPKEIN
jgi:hypothetical protein